MNALAAEIAIKMESLQCELLMGEHVPGTFNFVADALSRLDKGKPLPTSLHDSERRDPPERGEGFDKAWSLRKSIK